MTAGSGVATVFYRDTTVAAPTLSFADLPLPDNPQLGLATATQAVQITAGSPDRLAITGQATVVSGQAAGLEVHVQNAYGVDVAVASDLTVYLNSTSATATFSGDASFATPITELVVPAGSTDVAFFYQDSTAGPATITAADQPSGPEIGLAAASSTETVLAGDLHQIAFVTPSPSLEAGQPSAALVVQTEDRYANPAAVGADTVLYLSSTSLQGTFSASADFATTITSLTLRATQSSATVFYRDTASGSPVLTVSDQPTPDAPDAGLVNATQTATIVAGPVTQLAWGTPPELQAGESGTLSVQTDNAYGVPTPVPAAVTLYLSHTGPASGLSVSAGGPWTSSQFVLGAGADTEQLFYMSTAPVSDQVVVADEPLPGTDTGWTDATVTVAVVAGVPTQLALSAPPATVTAKHASLPTPWKPSTPTGPAAPATDTPLYLRSTSSAGQFASAPGGPWG